MPPPIFVSAVVALPSLIEPPKVPDWSLSPTVSVDGEAPLLRMMQPGPLPEVDSPLIVSLKPLRFHVMDLSVASRITTLPFPKPLGMQSLVPLMNVLPSGAVPPVSLVIRVVVPVQSLDGLKIEIVPVTVPYEPKVREYG